MSLSPSTSIQRPDLGLALEEFDLEASRAGFIGTKVFPITDVALATANFSRVKLNTLLVDRNTARAPGADYSRGTGVFEQDNYATLENGHEEVDDDSERNIYAYTIDSAIITTKRARDVVLRNLEKRVATKALDTAVWTGASYTTGVGTAWSVAASATPIADVDGAVKKVYDNFGVRANTVVISWKDYKNVRQCAQIVDRIKYSGRDDPKNVTAQMLAEIWDVEQVLIGDGQKNTANPGAAAASLSPIWTLGSVQVCKVARSMDLREVCIGRVFNFTGDGGQIGGNVEQYREEKVRGDVYRVRHQTGEKVINKECAHLLTGV